MKPGEEHARQLGERLQRFSFARVFTSPLQRASKTCELAGFGAVARVDPDLVEWDYGRFEGMVLKQVLKEQPGWELFRDGCPDGESPKTSPPGPTASSPVRASTGDVLAFSSGHIIRMIAARWLVRRTYYLLQMPGWGRRLRIMIDWTFALLFRPDIVKISLDSETAFCLRSRCDRSRPTRTQDQSVRVPPLAGTPEAN